MSKKWVFESLVKDDKDAVGLIAYALYKFKKHNLAKTLRANGRPESEIQKEVQTFHDHTLQNSLEDYREKAEAFLTKMVSQIEEEFQKKETDKINQLKKQHEKDLKNEKKRIFKNIEEYKHGNVNMFVRVGRWLVSGIPGIVSSLLITALFLGASVMWVSEETQKEVLRKLVSEALGLTLPPTLPERK